MGSYHHVAYQEGDLTFFVPSLFQHALYYHGEAVPMLITDLLQFLEKSKRVCIKYYQCRVSCLFWNNHPIGRVCVVGTLMGFKWKWINEQDYMFLYVDDFTFSSDVETPLLICKCPKELLMSCGLSAEHLTGKRLRLTGEVDIYHKELSLSDVELCSDLVLEIEHWRLSLVKREALNRPWEMSRQICEQTLTQDSGILADGNDYNEVLTTPMISRTKQTFVETLLVEEYKEELEIISPYREESQQEGETLDTSSQSSPPRVLIEDSVPQNLESSLLSLETYEGRDDEDIPVDKSIFTCSEAKARVQVLRYLLVRPDRTVPIVELYQASQINDIITDISTIMFNRQNLVHVKPLELLKTETFFEIVRKLITSGLVTHSNQNVIDYTPLKRLYSYSADRLLVLLKLQCYSGIIYVPETRQKLSLPAISHIAVLEVIKEALRVLVGKFPQVITRWWIEMKGQDSIVVHLEYSDMHRP